MSCKIECRVCGKERIEWREGKCVSCYREEHKRGRKKLDEYDKLIMREDCPLRYRDMVKTILSGEKKQIEYVGIMGLTRQRISYIMKRYTVSRR